MAKLDRNELIRLTQRIMAVDGTEAELEAMVLLLESNVPHPEVADLVYWPPNGVELTAEQVVDQALAYCPIKPPEQ